jgi:hypothetical protein
MMKFSPWGTSTEPLKFQVAQSVAPAMTKIIAVCTPICPYRPRCHAETQKTTVSL